MTDVLLVHETYLACRKQDTAASFRVSYLHMLELHNHSTQVYPWGNLDSVSNVKIATRVNVSSVSIATQQTPSSDMHAHSLCVIV